MDPDDVDPDVAESCALAHDLGHPPFGHVAEQALHKRAQGSGNDEGFEGNAQSFRIVTRLSKCDVAFDGLNLTRATLDGTLKYPWLHDSEGRASRKWGAYTTELADFAFARSLEPGEPVPGPEATQRSIEAQIMDWADDITYAVHDAEDFYRAGLVPLDRLKVQDSEREAFAQWVTARWAAQHRPYDENAVLEATRAVPTFFGASTPYDGSPPHRLSLRTFASTLIGRYVGATDVEVQGADVVALRIEPWAKLEVDVLKELVWRFVIERPALAAQQHGQVRIIEDLFDVFMTAAQDRDRLPVLPMSVQHGVALARSAGLDAPSQLARLVCDGICVLTEQEAVMLHRRLTGVGLGSVLDRVL